MKLFVACVLLFGVAAAGSFQGVIWYLPWDQMQRCYSTWKPENTWIHAKLQAGKHNWVPIGNPDFLISRGVYDLKDGPLLLRGIYPKSTFMSLSMYGGDTRVFGAEDNFGREGQPYAFLLRKSGSSATVPGAVAIDAPSDKGYLVIRLLVTKKLQPGDVDQVYGSASIAAVPAKGA